jgi:hypothetical protein
MNTIENRTATPVPLASGATEAAGIERARAVAEVQAMVLVAQQCPRNVAAAIARMEESCAQMALAEKAFYSFSRGGGNVSGPTVNLMKELARVFGNVTYGISELRRDDKRRESEVQAWAWDLETNTRAVQNFIVPHKRDKRGGAVDLTDLRDIYEATANAGARRLREAIKSVLPAWFVERAEEMCRQTLEGGKGDKPLPERIAGAIKAFQNDLGITEDQMEQRVGKPSTKWTVHDVTQLIVTYKAIQKNELDAEEAFPPVRVSVAELVAAPETKPEQADV